MITEEQQKQAEIFNQKIANTITEFTSETGLIIANIDCQHEIKPIGDTGMANINYKIKMDYGVGEG